MRLLAAMVVVLAPVMAGCGGDSEDDGTSDMKAVAKVMSALDTASRAGDGERICTQLFTPKLANSVSTSSSSGECGQEVKSKLFSPDSDISVEDIQRARRGKRHRHGEGDQREHLPDLPGQAGRAVADSQRGSGLSRSSP